MTTSTMIDPEHGHASSPSTQGAHTPTSDSLPYSRPASPAAPAHPALASEHPNVSSQGGDNAAISPNPAHKPPPSQSPSPEHTELGKTDGGDAMASQTDEHEKMDTRQRHNAESHEKENKPISHTSTDTATSSEPAPSAPPFLISEHHGFGGRGGYNASIHYDSAQEQPPFQFHGPGLAEHHKTEAENTRPEQADPPEHGRTNVVHGLGLEGLSISQAHAFGGRGGSNAAPSQIQEPGLGDRGGHNTLPGQEHSHGFGGRGGYNTIPGQESRRDSPKPPTGPPVQEHPHGFGGRGGYNASPSQENLGRTASHTSLPGLPVQEHPHGFGGRGGYNAMPGQDSPVPGHASPRPVSPGRVPPGQENLSRKGSPNPSPGLPVPEHQHGFGGRGGYNASPNQSSPIPGHASPRPVSPAPENISRKATPTSSPGLPVPEHPHGFGGRGGYNASPSQSSPIPAHASPIPGHISPGRTSPALERSNRKNTPNPSPGLPLPDHGHGFGGRGGYNASPVPGHHSPIPGHHSPVPGRTSPAPDHGSRSGSHTPLPTKEHEHGVGGRGGYNASPGHVTPRGVSPARAHGSPRGVSPAPSPGRVSPRHEGASRGGSRNPSPGLPVREHGVGVGVGGRGGYNATR